MTDINVQEVADKIIRLHEYTDRTGIIMSKSISGLLKPLNPEQTSAVIDLVTAALPPSNSRLSRALSGENGR